jgi:Domain of unknown function (DUF4157)/Lysine-specific metallo-endopeptidase
MSTKAEPINIKQETGNAMSYSRPIISNQPGLIRPLHDSNLHHQRSLGNSVIQRMMESNQIQAKLTVGQPNDKYEQEADQVAKNIMRMPADSAIQKKSNCSSCTDEEELLQTKSNGSNAGAKAVSPKLESGFNSMSGSGQPLSDSVRSYFEPHFGHDFRGVRVHTSREAAQMNRDLNAHAFTYGNSIYFNQGKYDPGTSSGKHLLAHELTHVIQQQSAPGIIRRYSTTDCSDPDVARIATAHQRGLDILAAAIARLKADPVTATTQTLFGYHFGAYANWRRSIVLGHFEALKSLMEGDSVTYQCEADCSDAVSEVAYTYWVFGDIHVCEPWLRRESVTETGEEFIHEHQHLRGSFDLGYHRNNVDNDTVWSVAINNADAFSELAQDLYEQP